MATQLRVIILVVNVILFIVLWIVTGQVFVAGILAVLFAEAQMYLSEIFYTKSIKKIMGLFERDQYEEAYEKNLSLQKYWPNSGLGNVLETIYDYAICNFQTFISRMYDYEQAKKYRITRRGRLAKYQHIDYKSLCTNKKIAYFILEGKYIPGSLDESIQYWPKQLKQPIVQERAKMLERLDASLKAYIEGEYDEALMCIQPLIPKIKYAPGLVHAYCLIKKVGQDERIFFDEEQLTVLEKAKNKPIIQKFLMREGID